MLLFWWFELSSRRQIIQTKQLLMISNGQKLWLPLCTLFSLVLMMIQSDGLFPGYAFSEGILLSYPDIIYLKLSLMLLSVYSNLFSTQTISTFHNAYGYSQYPAALLYLNRVFCLVVSHCTCISLDSSQCNQIVAYHSLPVCFLGC